MKKKNYAHTVKNNIFMVKLVWKANPGRIFAVLSQALINYAQWVFYTVVFMRFLFGSADNTKSFNQILIFVLAALVANGFAAYFSSWYNNRYAAVSDNILHYEINKMLFEKAAAVDISCYENPDFYDNYTKAVTEASTRAMSVIDSLSDMIAAILASVAVLYSMYGINRISTLFVILPVLANFFFGKIQNRIQYNKNMADIPFNRRQDYVNRAMYLQKFAKEIRLSKITEVLFDTQNEAYRNKLKNIGRYFKKLFLANFTRSTFCFLLSFQGLWIYAFYSAAVTKTIGMGDFVVLSSAIVSSTWMLINLTGSTVTIMENGLYINNLKEFLNYKVKISEDQPGIVPDPRVTSLEFKNVSFRYDGAAGYSLKNVSMKITEGEKIALVGENGAGKTTLVKLIMRLYDPTEGTILLNGIDIREYDLKAYRALIGTVFQDYQILSMTVLENVLMDNVADSADRAKAIEALQKSDVYDMIEGLPNRENTILTREFDPKGAVLSGGQFQKVAVARAFAKQSSILILDEPSSALDPIAEYKLYETIIKLCDTAENGIKHIGIFISHRLSSAVMADRVFMFEEGEIIEEGSHEELMRQHGHYCDMYTKQAESYLSGEEVL